jgi:lysophospholipase L1-like esterase
VTDCRLGVLAFGDSITNGGGELQWGVALQSWALWTARGLGLPYSGYASDGASVGDVLAEQIPAFELCAPEGRYDLGCLYIGVNDVRGFDWDRAAFERDHRAALAALAGRCDRLLTVTVPLDLGRPRAGAKVHEVDAAIEASARAAGALVVDLRGFGARNLLMADHVHPTAFGQIAIAERALDVLAAAGLPPRVRPSSLIRYETTRVGRLRGDLTFTYRHAKVSARAAAITARVRVAARRDRSRAGRGAAARSAS